MGRIHLLEDEVINKIAAGEVVERPASVVKELVENAIDAGATNVTIALELGGTRSIAVTDDGSGMDEDDAKAALQRHATSKIRAADDLYHIGTMGFRGEALASIAAVSRFSLATVQRGAAEGVKLAVSGGDVAVLPWNGPGGTCVTVENLFYNMPVRAKFLKAPATELGHCLELVQAFSLCHPEVGFTLRHNGREVFRVTPCAVDEKPWRGEAALRERAKAVIGKDAAQLLYVRSSSRFGDLEALASPPGLEKPTGKHVHTFVNGRWVKDKTVRYGVLRGYHSHLLKGRFPLAVVHLTMDPALVDVNVHPAKTELRFQYPGEVQNLIALALREKLREGTWAASPSVPDFGAPKASSTRAPAADFDLATPREPARLIPDDAAPAHTSALPFPGADDARTERHEPTDHVASGASRPSLPFADDEDEDEAPTGAPLRSPAPGRNKAAATVTRRSFDGARSAGAPKPAAWSLPPITDKASLDALLAPEGPRADEPREAVPWDELSFLGAFDRCFLFFEARGQLLVLDQHAFHERVLYERLTRDESLLSQSQKLLVPEAIELSPTEVAALRTRKSLLAQRGFAFQIESDTTVVVTAVPSILAGKNLADLWADLAKGHDEDNAELAHLILATAACHAAVRSGEELPPNELRQLLAEARTVDFWHNCPHGRRVLRWWTRQQVARWFDR